MGLDIYSRRITKCDGVGYFTVEEGFPEWTRDFERVMMGEVYDWDLYRDESGFDIDEYDIYCLRGTDEGEVLEFLPKENGFERIEGFTGVFYRHDDSLTVKEYDDAFTVNLSDRGWNAYLRFRSVHEFQHILRIIGYKDIANSFTLNKIGGAL